MLKMPVYGHKGHICFQIFIRITVGYGDQTIHLILFGHVDIGQFSVRITVGIADQQLIAHSRQHLLHIIYQKGKERID